MKQDQSISQKKIERKLRPSEVYPTLLPQLVKINIKVKELHKLTSQEAIGEITGVTRQAVSFEMLKHKKEASK